MNNERLISKLTYTMDTDNFLWRAMECIKKPIILKPPIKDSAGTWVKNNQRKPGVFAEYLQEVFLIMKCKMSHLLS